MTTLCACPVGPGHVISDPARHAAWHELVLAQGGPTGGVVNAETLQAARGFKTGTLDGETVLDERARKSGKRTSGAARRASR